MDLEQKPTGSLVVIGGGAAGMSAASRARRKDAGMRITVFESGDFVSFILCGIPYYVADVVKKHQDLVVYSPDFFRSKRNIDVRTGHSVTAIYVPGRTVEVWDQQTGQTETYGFDRLVIAAGAHPSTGPFTVEQYANAFTVHSLESAIAMKEFIRRENPRKAVVVGGGYIGLEMAEAFRTLGLEVTVIEGTGTVMPGVDTEITALIEGELSANKVDLHKNEMVRSLETLPGRPETVHRVVTDQASHEADIVVLAIGVRPTIGLGGEAGIALGETGGIVTDSRQETNVPGIYAAGDVAETRNLVTGRAAYLPLGTTANRQGRVAGESAAGGTTEFKGIVGSAAVKVFDIQVAKTGLSEAQAKEAGYEVRSATITHLSRSGFYPGAQPVTAKITADAASGALLGIQMAGKEGVPKRVDVVATALHAGLKVEDLVHLDLTYAPPFAQSYDVVHIAAEQVLKQL